MVSAQPSFLLSSSSSSLVEDVQQQQTLQSEKPGCRESNRDLRIDIQSKAALIDGPLVSSAFSTLFSLLFFLLPFLSAQATIVYIYPTQATPVKPQTHTVRWPLKRKNLHGPMSSFSPSPASRRLSLLAGPTPSSSTSSSPRDIDDSTRVRRYSTLRSSKSPSSSRRGSVYEFATRPRTLSRSAAKLKDLESLALSHRMSFLDFGDEPSSRLFGSLRERLHRKKSAPLLNNSLATRHVPPDDTDDFLTTSFPESTSIRPPLLRRSRGDANILFPVDRNPKLSFRSERKLTVMPEDVVDGMGYGIREARKASVTESDAGDDVDVSKIGYRAVPFRKRGSTILHAYPRTEAPYMRSYNKVDLQNDAYFHLLLRRLNVNGTPSFREYPIPPESVLDLGCGQGTWVQEAATAWAEGGTQIVGCDLVDHVNDMPKHPNVSWKRGNFVAYRLPFRSGSFDLVRLAGLTEAIPQYRWEHVLVEVRRILKPSGRVEIIDDEIVFPYPDLSREESGFGSQANSNLQTARSSWSSEQSKLSEEISGGKHAQMIDSSSSNHDSGVDRGSVGTEPDLCREDSPSEESSESLPTPTGVYGLATFIEHQSTLTTHRTQMPHAPLCQEIEKIYKTMLEGGYHVNSKPSDFLESLLGKVFGPAGKANTLKDFQLSLLDPTLHDLVVTTKHADSTLDSPRRPKRLFKVDRDDRRFERNKEILDKVIISQSKSKALRVLGADGPPSPICDPISTRASDDSDFSEESTVLRQMMRPRAVSAIPISAFPVSSRPSSSSSAASHTKSHHMPTGLFLYPDQFLETTPHELERYLCKHLDALLSCRSALDDLVLSLQDENGDPIVQEDEWHDMLWEYERSRRERFGLPNAGGQLNDAEDAEDDVASLLKEPARHSDSVMQPVAAAINNQSHPRHFSLDASETGHSSPTLVRRIRVFEAYKIKPDLPL